MDTLWDFRRRYFFCDANLQLQPKQLQSEAIQTRVQSFLNEKISPAKSADTKHANHFQKTFSTDRERQRSYLRANLSQQRVFPSDTYRVLGDHP